MDRDERTNADDLRRITELEAELRELRARAGLTSPESDVRIAEVLGDVRILELVPEFITIVDPSYRIAYLNRVRGNYSRAKIIGLPLDALIPAEDVPRLRADFAAVFAGRGARETEFRSHEGSAFVAHMVPVHDGKEVAFVVSVARDVTAERAAASALRESEARLRLAIRSSGIGTWYWSSEADRVEWDDTLCRIFGVDEGIGAIDFERYISFIVEEDRERVAEGISQALSGGVYHDIEHRILRPDGTERWLLCKGEVVRGPDGSVVGLRGGVFDVTDRHALERRAREAQTLEAVGRLTSGIAHNFNNLLAVIIPSVELARRAANPATASRLDDIEHAATRAAEMVRELMLFARGAGKRQWSSVDPGALASRTVSICRATFGSAIALALDIGPEIPSVAGNAGQLEQVLLNILLNARDALEDARSASPRIEVSVTAEDAGVVAIRISDNGPGMDERTCASVFEPFFTTKGVGRGTGLGLSSAYAIVLEHGGRIDCESRLGMGTTFRVELPIGGASLPAEAARHALHRRQQP